MFKGYHYLLNIFILKAIKPKSLKEELRILLFQISKTYFKKPLKISQMYLSQITDTSQQCKNTVYPE